VTVLRPAPMACAALSDLTLPRMSASRNARPPATRVPCGGPESGRVDVPALHRPENLKLVAFEPDVVGAQRG